jgi:hypothetical protein
MNKKQRRGRYLRAKSWARGKGLGAVLELETEKKKKSFGIELVFVADSVRKTTDRWGPCISDREGERKKQRGEGVRFRWLVGPAWPPLFRAALSSAGRSGLAR